MLPLELHEEFLLQQEAQMRLLVERQRRERRSATIAGAAAGLASVWITIGATRKAIFWHSFLLETIFCAVAGYWLVRVRGGVLKGILLFGGAYLLAFLFRALGFDPSVLFAAGDLSAAGAVTGNNVSLSFLVVIGALLGHIFET